MLRVTDYSSDVIKDNTAGKLNKVQRVIVTFPMGNNKRDTVHSLKRRVGTKTKSILV